MNLNVDCSVLEIPGVQLKEEVSLPSFYAPADGVFDGAQLKEEERVNLGKNTGFRQLPYTPQQNYGRELTDLRLNTVVMENDCLRATFLADYGARLWSLYDKEAKRELLFTNPVFRIANLAIRDAWFSGGIEWNLGRYGHTCLTCEPMFFAVCTGAGGERFLRVYEYERQNCLIGQLDFHLPERSRHLFVHVKIFNTSDERKPLYWWTNTAVREERNVRIFSGSEEIIRIRPETQMGAKAIRGFAHDRLPHFANLGGIDASYPQRIPYSNEYFFQNRAVASETWEAAAYDDGTAFWERSTPRLRYRKMFCWGNGRGGRHWKNFLSRDGEGDYVEIQAGLGPTQAHGSDIAPKACVRFTQAFGGLTHNITDAFDVWQPSRDYIHGLIEKRLSEDSLAAADLRYTADEDVVPDRILHRGSGWGALEAMRDPNSIPKSVIFPKDTLCEKQRPWLNLLEAGSLPEQVEDAFPAAWMTDVRWMTLLTTALKKEENQNAVAYLHLGVMLIENGRQTDGITAFRRSLALRETAIAHRCLAQIFLREGDRDGAGHEMENCLHLCGPKELKNVACDAISLFTKAGFYERAWVFFCRLPESIQSRGRVRLGICKAALMMRQLDFLDRQFTEEFADIREGETEQLTIWFHAQAMRLAQERGVENYRSLLGEVEATLTPPYCLDFRMSYM